LIFIASRRLLCGIESRVDQNDFGFCLTEWQCPNLRIRRRADDKKQMKNSTEDLIREGLSGLFGR
jgi:hypothetical protein